ncbi:hypothetical protein B0T19DRAFT_406208 [Cercophora scortea]|uniref:Uncharacterized protein n=1 Tax=Cercophora scortea TaxID=314031 RepID=A0AAE0J344_9PEZI|nr:hypothetical protein B0T19DRAFT_406208 [Cercophora scortea]
MMPMLFGLGICWYCPPSPLPLPLWLSCGIQSGSFACVHTRSSTHAHTHTRTRYFFAKQLGLAVAFSSSAWVALSKHSPWAPVQAELRIFIFFTLTPTTTTFKPPGRLLSIPRVLRKLSGFSFFFEFFFSPLPYPNIDTRRSTVGFFPYSAFAYRTWG